VFNEYRVLVEEEVKVLETDGEDGRTTVCTCLMHPTVRLETVETLTFT
jgi:hypothetical protein